MYNDKRETKYLHSLKDQRFEGQEELLRSIFKKNPFSYG